MAPRHLPIEQRLRARTAEDGDCWTWQGQTINSGYGVIGRGGRGGKNITIHKLGWQLASGAPAPSGFQVLHTCDVKLCWRNDEPGTYEVNGVIRPRFGHLWIGTQADNMADKTAKGRGTNPMLTHPGCAARGERHGTRTHPEKIRRGTAHHMAVLTEEIVREVRRRWSPRKITAKMLAREFGVSHTAIADALRRTTWQHVE